MTKRSGKINTHIIACLCIDGSFFLLRFPIYNFQTQDVQLNYQTAVKQGEAPQSLYGYARELLQISAEFYRVRATTYVEPGLVRAGTFNAVYQADHADYRLLQSLASQLL